MKIESKEEIRIELEKLENFLSFVKSHHEFAEDVFLQIQFLEELQKSLDTMYNCGEEGFKCEFSLYQKNASESLDKFIDNLMENLGIVLEDLFLKRKRMKIQIEKGKNAQESDS